MTEISRIENSRRKFRNARNGSTYFVVVAVASIATIAAFTASAISIANRNQSQLETSFTQANVSLRSALDIAINSIHNDPAWRSTYSANKTEGTAIATRLGNSSMEWFVTDPVDDNLSNQSWHPVKLFAVGKSDQCRRSISALAFPSGKGLDVLRSPLHATGKIELFAPVVAARGPLSADGQIKGHGNSIFGDMESGSQSNIANVYHSSFQLSRAKRFPSALVYSAYESVATKVDFDSLENRNSLKDQVISNTSAPSPTTNQNVNAIYLIEVPPATTLKISNTSVTGTLLIRLTGRRSRLVIDKGVSWYPLREQYPSLIVYCDKDRKNTIEINCKGNFSHPLTGAKKDSSLNGVFHVIRPAHASSKTHVSATRPIRGSILVEGDVQITNKSYLSASPDLVRQPPYGYQDISSGTSLLDNSSFEDGLSPWYANVNNYRGGGTKIQRTDSSIDGTHAVKICDRFSNRSGLVQEVSRKLANGHRYTGSFAAKMENHDESLVVALRITDQDGTRTTTLSTSDAKTSWRSFRFSFAPSWNGELQSAKLLVYTSSTNQAFQVDNFLIPNAKTDQPTNLVIFPSTIRLE